MAVSLGASPTIDCIVPTSPIEATLNDPVKGALRFLETLDQGRLLKQDYAERVVGEIDIVRASSLYVGELKASLDITRLITLWGSRRSKDALVFADSLLAGGAARPEVLAWAMTISADTAPLKAVDYLERADKDLRDVDDRTIFKDKIEHAVVAAVNQALVQAKDHPNSARFAEGLLKFGWPGEGQFATRDTLRMIALRGRLARGDVAGARALSRQIADPSTALELIITKVYDSLLDDGTDRFARMTALMAEEDRRSAQALKAAPDNLKLIRARGEYLRSAGRDGEALSLMLPHAAEMGTVLELGSDAFWVVNDTAYTLATLGQHDEAIALMERLIASGLDKHPDLINMAINLAEIMNRAGRPREAAAYAETLVKLHAGKANKYGLMLMWEAAACGYATSGHPVTASRWIARLRTDPNANRAALVRGLLCTGDLDGAAQQMIDRLNSDDTAGVLIAVQAYTIAGTESANERMLDERLQQVVVRPDVAAAIASKGRILKLPLSRTYWGMF